VLENSVSFATTHIVMKAFGSFLIGKNRKKHLIDIVSATSYRIGKY